MPKSLQDAIIGSGLTPLPQLIEDGRFHRFWCDGDARSRKLGWYKCTREGDLLFCAYGHWSRGISEKWSSKTHKQMTKDEHKAIAQMRADNNKREKEAHEKAALKAERLYSAAEKKGSHPYLQRKGIKLLGAKLWNNSVIVPIYDDGKICSAQIISDTQKRFITGGKKKGCYTSVRDKSSSVETIVICEGWATAVSLNMALNCAVVVAFDAYNLTPVADKIRAKYPDSAITIAADNDCHKKLNVGITEARKAAEKIGARVVYPVFDEGDSESTDFNDLHQKKGEQAIRDAFATREEVPPDYEHVPYDDTVHYDTNEMVTVNDSPNGDWKTKLIAGDVIVPGYPEFDGASVYNAKLIVQYDSKTAGCLIYDEFSDAVLMVRRPPWDNCRNFEPRPIAEKDFVGCQMWLETKSVSVSKSIVYDIMMFIAYEKTVNPPKEYMEGLKWDGNARLDFWLSDYTGSDQPGNYLTLVGSKWMIGAVSRIYQPGCKFDSVLILEGAQGIGKSKVLRELATFNGVDLFLDSVGDLKNKDTVMTMQGKLIIELAELASFKKSENEEIKGFISRQIDEYRPPYGKTVVKRGRRFVFAGSTNEGDLEGYLTDHTGNRRYWPVTCKKLDVDGVIKNREQLWAEAVFRYKNNERTWLEDSELFLSEGEQKKREVEDAWMPRIEAFLNTSLYIESVTVDEVCENLELKPKDVNNIVKKRIKGSLTQLGWVEGRQQGSNRRVWRKA